MNTFVTIVTIGVIFYIVTCIAFIDIAFKDFGSLPKKAMWGIIAFIPFIGCIIYFIFGFKKGKRIKYTNPQAE